MRMKLIESTMIDYFALIKMTIKQINMKISLSFWQLVVSLSIDLRGFDLDSQKICWLFQQQSIYVTHGIQLIHSSFSIMTQGSLHFSTAIFNPMYSQPSVDDWSICHFENQLIKLTQRNIQIHVWDFLVTWFPEWFASVYTLV